MKFVPNVPMRHFIYTYKGKVYQSEKHWSFGRVESVLTRIGATWWEIEISEEELIENKFC